MKNILCVGCTVFPEARYSRLLRASGYKSTLGTIGQVLPELRTGRLSADLVIVECHSFSRGSEDLLWQLMRAAPDIPFILLTNDVTVESYLRSMALGIHESLCMTVANAEVLKIVRAVIGKARLKHLSHPEEQAAGSLSSCVR